MNLSLPKILPITITFLGNCASIISGKPITDDWIEKTRDAQNDLSVPFYPMALGAMFTASLSLLFSGSSFLVFIGLYFKYKTYVAQKHAKQHQSARDHFNMAVAGLTDSIFNKTLDIKGIIEKLYVSFDTTMNAIDELRKSFEYLKLDYSSFKREIDGRLSDFSTDITNIISNHEKRILNLVGISALDNLYSNLYPIYEEPNKIPKPVMENSFSLFNQCDTKNDHDNNKISKPNIINL